MLVRKRLVSSCKIASVFQPSRSQNLTVPSWDLEARMRPSGEKRMHLMPPVCPSRITSGSSRDRLHTTIVESVDPEASNSPSGDQLKLLTQCLWGNRSGNKNRT